MSINDLAEIQATLKHIGVPFRSLYGKFTVGEYKKNHGSSGGALLKDIETGKLESMIVR